MNGKPTDSGNLQSFSPCVEDETMALPVSSQHGGSSSPHGGKLPSTGIQALREDLSDEHLGSMQAVLRRCTLEHVAYKGLNFRNMIRNLRGIGKIEVGDVKLFTLLTRNNAFLLSNLVAEELHDHVKGFMDLSLGDRAILNDNGKRRFLYRVPANQVDTLRTIANQNQFITATGFPFRDVEQFKRRLARCSVDGSFDVCAFAESVKLVSNLYEDASNNQYHHIVAGEMEYPYLLYVMPRDPVPNAVKLHFGATSLALVRD